MNSGPYSEAALERVRDMIVDVARAVVDDQMSVLEAAQHLCNLDHRLLGRQDPDFAIFETVQTETVTLPVGAERRFWSEEALAARDDELQAAENRYREPIQASCRRILSRMQGVAIAEILSSDSD